MQPGFIHLFRLFYPLYLLYFPFSLGDIFIFLSISGIIVFPIAYRINKGSWKKGLLKSGEYLLWVYVWFYMAWGLNYFREGFNQRLEIAYPSYSQNQFQTFLDEYINELNAAYVVPNWIDRSIVDEEVKKGYDRIYQRFGMTRPRGWQRGKTMLFTPLFSKVGVTGYMGPFFSEYHLNGDLLSVQYPATYAHEMAHLLGIANEAEANLYAFLVCKDSSNPQIRFSGYFSLFSHVLRNANGLLPEEEYRELLGRINPEILQLYKDKYAYWSDKYSPFIGEIQDKLYDLFLKGNQIPTGMKNYSEVIGLLLAFTASTGE